MGYMEFPPMFHYNDTKNDSTGFVKEAKKRFLWMKDLFSSEFPKIEEIQKLYTPFEQKKFENKTIEQIVDEQRDYWQSNHYLYEVLKALKSYSFIIKEIKNLAGAKFEPLNHEISKKEVSFLSKRSLSLPFNLSRFIADSTEFKLKVVWEHSIVPNKIQLEGNFALLLSNQPKIDVSIGKSYIFPNFLDIINYIVVYTDFIENQYFGDSFTPILKIVPVLSRESSHIVSYFDNPHYVPVRTSSLNSINITLRDLQGEKIHFEDPFLFIITKLHFKKI